MNNSAKIIGGIVGIFSVIALISVVWANFTQNLEINGTGTVGATSWDISFVSLSDVELTGTAKEITKPELTSTKIGDYAVQLSTPGDSISYTFDVKNNGSYAAEISSITIPTPSCEGSGDNADTDAENVCKRLSYTLTYDDGQNVSYGDPLAVGETKTMVLKLMYSTDTLSSELPTNDVTISNLTIPIIYMQS